MAEKLDNGFWALCPSLANCYARGLSYEETFDNIKLAIEGKLEEAAARREEIRPADAYSFCVLEV
jgi:predicted RNase H-like HicB family nuclease